MVYIVLGSFILYPSLSWLMLLVYSKSMETEAVFTKTEINNE